MEINTENLPPRSSNDSRI